MKARFKIVVDIRKYVLDMAIDQQVRFSSTVTVNFCRFYVVKSTKESRHVVRCGDGGLRGQCLNVLGFEVKGRTFNTSPVTRW